MRKSRIIPKKCHWWELAHDLTGGKNTANYEPAV